MSEQRAATATRSREAGLGSLVLVVLLSGPTSALAGLGGPDCFGYTWVDQCSGCSLDIPTFGPDAQTWTGVTDVVGPVDLGFLGRWYGRPVTEVWVAPSGYVTFSDQGPNVGLRQFLADPAPPNDLFAVDWLDVVDADITVEATPDFFHVRWVQRWVLDPTRPWYVHLLIFPDGRLSVHWPLTWGQLYTTVGYEDSAGSCGRTLMQGDPDTLTVYRDEGTFPGPGQDLAACVLPPRRLDCSDPTPLVCGASRGSSLPGPDLSPTSAWSCDSNTWEVTERAFELQVDELADVDVVLWPSSGQWMGLFHPEDCDEWACTEGGATSLTLPGVTPGDHAVFFVDGRQTGLDEGNFTLDVTCRPLAQTLACGAAEAGSTVGGTTRLDGYACAASDFSGAETYYRVDLAPPDQLQVSLNSASGQAVFVFDAAAPLDPALCLAGGSDTAWLPAPAAGTYLIVVDGPAGSEAAFDLQLDCRAQLDCPLGGERIDCNDEVVGSTVGAASLVDLYRCDDAVYSGPEVVHTFDNPIRQVVSLLLDDSAEPRLDLVLLDSCNEQACLAIGDSKLSIELDPGSYRIVVDGRGAAGDYTLSTVCGAELQPALLSVSAEPGDCFTEHKTLWLAPEAPPLDVLFSIDLTGSMIPERAQLPLNVIDIIERLPDFLPDVAFGLVSHRDYYYPCLGWGEIPCRFVPSDFGQEGDYPYALHQAISKDHQRVLSAAQSLPPADLGGSSGESYNRVMYEAVNDPEIAWRPGSRRMLVTFGDDLPHNCDLAACFGGPPIQRGIDLGLDGAPDTGDELPTLEMIQGLIDSETILLHLDSSAGLAILGIPYSQFWDCWAQMTGGLAEELNDDGSPPAGLDIATLIADLVERRQACPTLELVAEPGFEDWLNSAVPVLADAELPVVAEFDIEICVPPGTPAGVYDFEVQALCGAEIVAAQQVVVRVGLDCLPQIDTPPADAAICPNDSVELDASGLSLTGCAGTVEYEWREGPATIANTPTVDVSPETTTLYEVFLTCSSDPDCSYSDDALVTVLDDFPDGVYATLRARHEGDEATYHWLMARDLLPGEHFHLLKASDDPTADFLRVNPEADLTREFTETDVSSPLQFFDLRVATACEVQSEDEYPPTYP